MIPQNMGFNAKSWSHDLDDLGLSLVNEQFAIENCQFRVDLPMKHGDFP